MRGRIRLSRAIAGPGASTHGGAESRMDSKDVLIERWRGWQASIEARDVAAAAAYLADDYALELVQPDRAIVPRDAWLGLLPDYVVSGYDIESQIVDVSGDLGLILHRARQEATVYGEDRSGTFVLTDIWRLSDGTWRVWRRHSTPLSAGVMPQTRT